MGVVSVGTTATEIATRFPTLYTNNGPVTVFVGGSNSVTADMSSTGGHQLHPGESINLSGDANNWTLWGITANGTAYVSYLPLYPQHLG